MGKRDIGIGQRLALGFGLVLTFLVLAVGFSLYAGQQEREATNYLAEQVMPRADAANDLETAYLYESAGARSYILTGDEHWLTDYRKGVTLASDAISRLGALPKTPQGTALFNEMTPLAESFTQSADKAIALRQQGKSQEALQVLNQEMLPTREQLLSKSEAFVTLQLTLRDQAKATADRLTAENFRNSLAIAVFALICGALFAYYTARSVQKPIRALVLASDRLADGAYSSAIDVTGVAAGTRTDTRDEVKQLAGRFRLACQELLRREDHLMADSALSAALASTIEAREFSETALRVLAEHVGAEAGAVYRCDSEARVLIAVASSGLGEGVAETAALRDGIATQAATTRRTVTVRDVPEDLPTGEVRLGVDEVAPRWIVAVPMLVQDELVGTVVLAGVRSLNQEGVDFLQSSAGQLAVSLQNALAHEKIKAQNEQLQTQNEEIQAQTEEIQAQTEEIQVQNEELQAQNEEREQLLTQVEEERGRVRAVLEQMPSGVFIAEAPTGKLVAGNEQAMAIWRHPFVPAGTVSEYEAYSGFHPDGTPYLPEEWPIARALRGEVVRGEEITILRGDRSYGMTSQSAAPIKDADGRIVSAVVVLTDITERKQAEAEREQLVEKLREINEKLTVIGMENRVLAERAERRAAQMEEFTSLLSHDLKTPMTVIQGHAQMIERSAKKPDLVRRSAEAIFTSAKSMTMMITQLTEMGRLETGQLKLNLVPMDILFFLGDLKSRLSSTLSWDRISLDAPEEMPAVQADRSALERIVTNLVSNALKYSEGQVDLIAKMIGDRVEITVRDRGPGIPEDQIPKLFDRFYRTAGAEKTEGLGLGLYITRMLVEAHGGKIRVESEDGKGSTFIVELPREGASLSTIASPPREMIDSRRTE